MPDVLEAPPKARSTRKETAVCYHCGTPCIGSTIYYEEKAFCCDGCKLVFEILNNKGLCDYYALEQHPGLTKVKSIRNDKFAFLDDTAIEEKLCSFTDGDYSIITLYIPGVHCSSCMWLLEHLRHLNEGITESRMNFGAKELTIHFSRKKIRVRAIAELLTTIGYEPNISMEDAEQANTKARPDRKRMYRMGIAGFCFANIMMMSFPEYFGGFGFEKAYANFLRFINLGLGTLVFFYSAGEFFTNAWNGLKLKTLNIDAPIALAIVITFGRSVFEILSGTGAGYLDSMSGIVFFMLVGRAVQERTYRSISFHRDYKSYFPIAVTLIRPEGSVVCSLHDLKEGDIALLHNDEIIPADSLVLEGTARVDYSFVTGESEPVKISEGNKIYAGGRQIGEGIKIRIEKPVAGSYLTSLWNHHAFSTNKAQEDQQNSSIHMLSRYFTIILFSLALITGIYWAMHDPSKILGSVTAMLIVACPCALLLSASFTNGNLMRIFSNAGLYLRDASVIEQLSKINHIVFDKTGTLTQGMEVDVCSGSTITGQDLRLLNTATQSSQHPYSKALNAWSSGNGPGKVESWVEIPGKGIIACIDGVAIRIGSSAFTYVKHPDANVYAHIGVNTYAFRIHPHFRNGLKDLLSSLGKRFRISLLSGDNARQQSELMPLFGPDSILRFGQQPLDKLHFIAEQQSKGQRLLMIGDGLNDAGALQQSNVGITLADDVNNFSPACDAILDAKKFNRIGAILKMARAGRTIIRVIFVVSIFYNLCGLFFAIQGKMSPMIAAILMPVSTLSIVLLSTGLSSLIAKWQGLTRN